jgi:hypothetical protein
MLTAKPERYMFLRELLLNVSGPMIFAKVFGRICCISMTPNARHELVIVVDIVNVMLLFFAKAPKFLNAFVFFVVKYKASRGDIVINAPSKTADRLINIGPIVIAIFMSAGANEAMVAPGVVSK